MPFDSIPLEDSDWLLRTLVGMRRLLQPRGAWIQKFEHLGDSFCLLGAMRWTDREMQHGHKTEKERSIVAAIGFRDYSSMTGWNDKKGRRKRDVLNRIDRAIERRRAVLLEKADAS